MRAVEPLEKKTYCFLIFITSNNSHCYLFQPHLCLLPRSVDKPIQTCFVKTLYLNLQVEE
jgi:hypothetical protein